MSRLPTDLVVVLDRSGSMNGPKMNQAKQAIRTIESALKEAGSSLRDVVRTRAFITDVSLFSELSRAHGEAFGEIRPAAAMVEVSALATPEMLVEIEADAIIGSG